MSKTAIGHRFDGLAERYQQHAVLEREVASRLFARLTFQHHLPGRILDLGCGPGNEAAELKRRYRKAQVIALDLSLSMCRLARRQSRFLHPVHAVCADFSALPFAHQSVDLVFSNLAMQWSAGFPGLTAELRRVLRPDGFVVFSTLGPGSLREIPSAAALPGLPMSTHPLPDVHVWGDALLAAGFARPVVDSETITIEYQQLDSFFADLRATGADARLLAGGSDPGVWEALAGVYEPLRRNGAYPVTWEIIYAAAFGPAEGQAIKSPDGDVAAFSVDHLRKSVPRN